MCKGTEFKGTSSEPLILRIVANVYQTHAMFQLYVMYFTSIILFTPYNKHMG